MKPFKFFQLQPSNEGFPQFYVPESTGTESPLLRYFDLLFPYYHTRYVVWDRPDRISEDMLYLIYVQSRNSILNGDALTYLEIRDLLMERFYRHTGHYFSISEDIHNNIVSQI